MPDGHALPGWPLLLRREMAALYLGMSPSTFDGERRAGRAPQPIRMTASIEAWHRADLEAWVEERRASTAGPNPWD